MVSLPLPKPRERELLGSEVVSPMTSTVPGTQPAFNKYLENKWIPGRQRTLGTLRHLGHPKLKLKAAA